MARTSRTVAQVRLLFLHALPFGGEMWANELRHFGPEAKAPTLYDEGETLEDWARAALRAVGTESFLVIGCSVGGSCAFEAVRLAPKQVAGIVLVGAKAGVRPEPEARDEALARLTADGLDAAWTSYWRPLFGPNTPDATLDHAFDLALRVGTVSVARGIRAFHNRLDRSAVADDWVGPLIGVCGEHDRVPGVAVMRQLTRGPSRELHVVENCGHYVNLEQPDRFLRLLDNAIELIASHRSARYNNLTTSAPRHAPTTWDEQNR